MESVCHIRCLGRSAKGTPALHTPVDVKITINQHAETITLSVKCPHNTGGHGQRCKASHPPGVDKVGQGVTCPYSLDIPYYHDQTVVGF